jgi:hypothetical protein
MMRFNSVEASFFSTAVVPELRLVSLIDCKERNGQSHTQEQGSLGPGSDPRW